jgi:hypothetical protein
MVNLTLNIDLDDVIDEMSDLAKKQVPYAAFLALKETAYKVSVAVKKDLPYYIEGGPVAFTARGVRYVNPKSKRDLMAMIYIPKDQWKYMRWIVEGGKKRWSRSQFGIGKPIYANTRFNKYGNIPGRKRKEAAWRSAMAKQESGNNALITEGLGKNEFLAKTKNGDWALFRRVRKKVKLLMVFNDEADYGRPRFPFQKITVMHTHKMYGKFFNKHLTRIVNNESKKLRAR